MPTSRGRKVWMATVAGLLLLAACSSTTDDPDTASDTTTTSDQDADSAAPAFDPASVATATIEPPPVEGKGGVVLGAPSLDLSTVGYEETEWFVSGTATSYTSEEELTSDGMWSVEEDETAGYTTRVVVRQPSDPADFNGTVYVEWLNVTAGLDAAPDWTFSHVEIIREGAVWIGVSAQVVGIEGSGGPGDILALKTFDPERYGPLDHPGDDYSYDIFSQVGATARTNPDLLDGLEPERVIAMGESQSAGRLSTYVNALAPTLAVYDAYLVHSRGSGASPLRIGARVQTRGDDAAPPDVAAPDPTMIRTDLGVPVLVLSSESDLIGRGLGYASAYQPDSDFFRSWEVPGTAHVDAYGLGTGDFDDGTGPGDLAAFEDMIDPPATAYFGFVECDAPINAGPHTYLTRAALHHLDQWVRTGEGPPEMPRIDVTDDGSAYELDDHGNVTGGIRTPHLDVPIATLSGSGQSSGGFCFLFGTTVPFDAETLAALYPDHATFVEQWNDATDDAVDSGAILEVDGEALKDAASASTIGS